ncbi:MAG TPA: hypothetical protein VFJ58_29980 [Armatimonadota bacterium]|nr:hypothetical protein [Armatimonadota bacterium]
MTVEITPAIEAPAVLQEPPPPTAVHSRADRLYRRRLALQWGMLTTLLLFFFSVFVFVAGLRYSPGNSAGRAFWFAILAPAGFIASVGATLLGRAAIGIQDYRPGWGRRPRRCPRLSRWFHPTHAVRDVTFIAAVFSLPYALLVAIGQSHHLIPVVSTLPGWLLFRLPIVLLLSVVSFFAVGAASLSIGRRWQFLTRDAIIPHWNRGQLRASRWYVYYTGWLGVTAFLTVLLIQPFLVGIARGRPSLAWPILLLIALAAIQVAYWKTHRELQDLAAALQPARVETVEASLVLIGPPAVGKTVFLERAYRLLQKPRRGGVVLEPTPESREELKEATRAIEEERRWAGGTVSMTRIPFMLRYGRRPFIRFHWLEVPGGIFSQREEERYSADADAFDRELPEAGAVAMLIDGIELAQHSAGHEDDLAAVQHAQIYFEKISQFYGLQNGRPPRNAPVAIIVTKWCRVDPRSKGACLRRLDQLLDEWRRDAEMSQLPCPLIRIFFTSAVIVTGEENDLPQDRSQPLQSSRCVEPIFWLAAQILRENLGLWDLALDFEGRSPLQEIILELEARALEEGPQSG